MSGPGDTTKNVFISYRREPNAADADRLKEWLERRRPTWRIFLDVGSIRPGQDFLDAIGEFLEGGVLLAIVGHGWNPVVDGRRRLDDPTDTVRFELESAAARELPVVPVFVGGASMPPPAELPPSLGVFRKRNGIALRRETYVEDVDKLIAAVEELVIGRYGGPNRVEPVAADRRGRTVRLLLRHEQYLVEFRTSHGPRNVLKVDGRKLSAAEVEVEDSGRRFMFRFENYAFTLADGHRAVPILVRVRYASDSMRVAAMDIHVDHQEVYADGEVHTRQD